MTKQQMQTGRWQRTFNAALLMTTYLIGTTTRKFSSSVTNVGGGTVAAWAGLSMLSGVDTGTTDILKTPFPAVYNLSTLNGKDGFSIFFDDSMYSSPFWDGAITDSSDVNGDGYYDIILSGPHYLYNVGRLWGVFGNSTLGTSSVISLNTYVNYSGFTIDATWHEEYFTKESHLGDVNGDGYSDVVTSGKYAIYVFYGGSYVTTNSATSYSVLNGTNGFILKLPNLPGPSIPTTADINGDGYSDLIFPAPLNNNWQICVLFGKADMSIYHDVAINDITLNGNNGFMFMSDEQCYYTWWSCRFAKPIGDINNDNIYDMLYWDNVYNEIYVIFGGRNIGGTGSLILKDINGQSGFKILTENNNIPVISTIPNVGDINGDGVSDLMLGVFPGDSTAASKSYVVFGKSNIGINGNISLASLNGKSGFSILGSIGEQNVCMATIVGDVNNDGYSDFAIPIYSNNNNYFEVYTIFGSSNIGNGGSVFLYNLNRNKMVIFNISSSFSRYTSAAGCSSAISVKDINGDGNQDLAISFAWAPSNPTGDYWDMGKGYNCIVFGRKYLTITPTSTVTATATYNYSTGCNVVNPIPNQIISSNYPYSYQINANKIFSGNIQYITVIETNKTFLPDWLTLDRTMATLTITGLTPWVFPYTGEIRQPGVISSSSIVVSNNVAYIPISGADGLQLVNISDIKNPVTTGKVTGIGSENGGTWSVEIVNEIAYLCRNTPAPSCCTGRAEGVYLIDTKNITVPSILGAIELGYRGVHDLKVIKDIAYIVTDYWGDGDAKNFLSLYNISDPAEPTFISNIVPCCDSSGHFITWDPSYLYSSGYHLQVSNGVAYIISVPLQSPPGKTGLVLINVSKPNMPLFLSSIKWNAFYSYNIQVLEDLAYTATETSLIVINISNPYNITILSNFIIGNYSNSCTNCTRVLDFTIVKNLAYIFVGYGTILYNNELLIVDISNAQSFYVLSTYAIPSQFAANSPIMTIKDGNIFITDNINKFSILSLNSGKLTGTSLPDINKNYSLTVKGLDYYGNNCSTTFQITVNQELTYSQTETPSSTPSDTPTATPAGTPTGTPTSTPTPTPSETKTDTATPTPTPSDTLSKTPTGSSSPTSTNTDSSTASNTDSASPTGTHSATLTDSQTPSSTTSPSSIALSNIKTSTISNKDNHADSPTTTIDEPVVSRTISASTTLTDSSTGTLTKSEIVSYSTKTLITPSSTAILSGTPALSQTPTPASTKTDSSTFTPTAVHNHTKTPASVVLEPSPSASPIATPSEGNTVIVNILNNDNSNAKLYVGLAIGVGVGIAATAAAVGMFYCYKNCYKKRQKEKILPHIIYGVALQEQEKPESSVYTSNNNECFFSSELQQKRISQPCSSTTEHVFHYNSGLTSTINPSSSKPVDATELYRNYEEAELGKVSNSQTIPVEEDIDSSLNKEKRHESMRLTVPQKLVI